ncbi:MAG: uroporphyrinogen decarboxylase family protein [Planctomycetota bacterium]
MAVAQTSRERFHATMRYGAPDRVPCLEEGLRDDVLDRWKQQGLPPGADLDAMFHYDRRELLPVDIRFRPDLKKFPTSRRGLRALRRRLDPDDPGRFPDDWAKQAAAWRTRDHILQFQVHRGFFLSMGVGDWTGFARAVYQLADSPRLVREIMEMHAQFAVHLAEKVLAEVDVDFASFSEPIGGSGPPLLSPRCYEEFVLSNYLPVIDVLHRRGVETIALVTYSDVRAYIPMLLKAGINCLWISEANSEAIDYRELRREFGRDLRLIGGIDLDVLLLGKEEIRREIETKVPPLLAEGGYIPLADGRVRANVPFEGYAYYRRVLEEVTRRRI